MSNWKFNKDGWTGWITHDGSGCPCVGMYTQTEHDHGDKVTLYEGMAKGLDSWYWSDDWDRWFTKIIRYRIRKPKGLTMLENLLQEEPVTQEE